jgi:predicted phage terminase large subunit-like protein
MGTAKKGVDEDLWRSSPEYYAERMSGGKWIRYRHLDYVAKIARKAIYQGGARLIFTMPPRHGKSEFLTNWVATWFLDTWSDKKVIVASYGDRLAKFFGRRVKNNLMDNELSTVTIRTDSKAATEFETDEGGGMITAGIGGSITGRGGDLILIDDPIKTPQEAFSPVVRESQKEWFRSVLYTRLEPGGTIILIMTRWHEDDLAGWLLREHEDKWTLINLPALAEKDDPLGREPGKALCPERYDEKALNEILESIKQRPFEAIYQGHPTPLEGAIFKRQFWKRWKELPEFQEVKQSWDTTVKEDGTSFVVGQVWGRRGADKYLLDQIRGKWGMTELLDKFRKLSAKHPKAHRKEVEAKANGPAIENLLKREIPGIILVEPLGGKEVRALAVAPQVESGNVFIPADEVMYPWVDGFIEECASFPRSENDDQVDAMTQAIVNWSGGMLAFGGKERKRPTNIGGLK